MCEKLFLRYVILRFAAGIVLRQETWTTFVTLAA